MNNFTTLIRYFGENRAVTPGEFRDFWESCSVDWRDYFRHVDVQTGIVPDGSVTHLLFIEKTCSVCSKISWGSSSGYFNETHYTSFGDTIKLSACDTDGNQYWQYSDGSVEIRDGNEKFVKVVD